MEINSQSESCLEVSLSKQQLYLLRQDAVIAAYPVSTAKNGPGELMGSECTPRGWHKIRAKIGQGEPLNAVFTGRRPTGEVYSLELGYQFPERDWILTRILWLGGLEPGKNRYGSVDSTWRYIYIHGCPDERMHGRPESHGCIRMKNADVLDLFNRVKVGELVYIHE